MDLILSHMVIVTAMLAPFLFLTFFGEKRLLGDGRANFIPSRVTLILKMMFTASPSRSALVGRVKCLCVVWTIHLSYVTVAFSN